MVKLASFFGAFETVVGGNLSQPPHGCPAPVLTGGSLQVPPLNVSINVLKQLRQPGAKHLNTGACGGSGLIQTGQKLGRGV